MSTLHLDSFILDSGLVKDVDAPEDLRAVLMRRAEQFLRAGGVVTFEFWRTLDPVSRAAFAAAGDAIARERAMVPYQAAKLEGQDARVLTECDRVATEVLS